MSESENQLLKEVHAAIVGNVALGHKGLVQRMDEVEGRVEGHDRKLLTWSGGLIALVGAGSYVKAWLERH